MTIERVCSPNSIIYYLPPGKADTKQKREVGPDNRSRVVQKKQKGPNCQYYALALLVGRIGGNCDPAFAKARVAEVASQMRKKSLTIISLFYENSRELYEKYQRACESNPDKNIMVIPSEGLSEENQIRFKKLLKLIEEKKKEDPNISVTAVKELIRIEEYKEKIQAQEKCIKLLGFDPRNIGLYRQELFCTYTEDVAMEVPDSISELKRLRNLHAVLSKYTFELLLRARGCRPSTWTPPFSSKLDDDDANVYAQLLGIDIRDEGEKVGFKGLRSELEFRGPALVSGYFGPAYYKENAQVSYVANRVGSRVFSDLEVIDKLDSQELKNKDFHVVVLLGAGKSPEKPSRRIVYFMDPNDDSTPECQRIYRLAFSEFCKLIVSLDSEKTYLYHYNQ